MIQVAIAKTPNNACIENRDGKKKEKREPTQQRRGRTTPSGVETHQSEKDKTKMLIQLREKRTERLIFLVKANCLDLAEICDDVS